MARTRYSALLVVADALPAFSAALETLKSRNAFEFRPEEWGERVWSGVEL